MMSFNYVCELVKYISSAFVYLFDTPTIAVFVSSDQNVHYALSYS